MVALKVFIVDARGEVIPEAGCTFSYDDGAKIIFLFGGPSGTEGCVPTGRRVRVQVQAPDKIPLDQVFIFNYERNLKFTLYKDYTPTKVESPYTGNTVCGETTQNCVLVGQKRDIEGFTIGLRQVHVSVLPFWADVTLNGQLYQLELDKSIMISGYKITLYFISLYNACFTVIPPAPAPPVTEPPPGTEPPTPYPEPPPEPSWDFSSFGSTISSLWLHIRWLGDLLVYPLRVLVEQIRSILSWLSDFWNALDAWVSRLFGVDPAGPFLDQVLHRIDIWISARLGVDPDKPLLDEIAKKIMSWFFSLLDDKVKDEPEYGKDW